MDKFELISFAEAQHINEAVSKWDPAMFNDAKTVARGAIREYLANQLGKTYYKSVAANDK